MSKFRVGDHPPVTHKIADSLANQRFGLTAN